MVLFLGGGGKFQTLYILSLIDKNTKLYLVFLFCFVFFFSFFFFFFDLQIIRKKNSHWF